MGAAWSEKVVTKEGFRGALGLKNKTDAVVLEELAVMLGHASSGVNQKMGLYCMPNDPFLKKAFKSIRPKLAVLQKAFGKDDVYAKVPHMVRKGPGLGFPVTTHSKVDVTVVVDITQVKCLVDIMGHLKDALTQLPMGVSTALIATHFAYDSTVRLLDTVRTGSKSGTLSSSVKMNVEVYNFAQALLLADADLDEVAVAALELSFMGDTVEDSKCFGLFTHGSATLRLHIEAAIILMGDVDD